MSSNGFRENKTVGNPWFRLSLYQDGPKYNFLFKKCSFLGDWKCHLKSCSSVRHQRIQYKGLKLPSHDISWIKFRDLYYWINTWSHDVIRYFWCVFYILYFLTFLMHSLQFPCHMTNLMWNSNCDYGMMININKTKAIVIRRKPMKWTVSNTWSVISVATWTAVKK